MYVNPFPYDFVVVEWLDAEAQSEWRKISEQDEPDKPVATFGFLIKRGKMLTLAASIYEEDDECTTNSRMHIPRGMVKTITVLFKKATKAKGNKPSNAATEPESNGPAAD